MSGLRLAPSAPRRAFRVLCLGAHADDIEIGCGATLLRLRRLGARVHFHWVVWSATGVRAAEAGRSQRRLLGARVRASLDLHGFRDGFFPSEYAGVKEAFERLARRFQPDLVLTHHRADRHQDHRVVSDLTWNTFRRHHVLEYEVPKWDGDLGQPNLYVPLSAGDARRKVRHLLAVFSSQRAKDWFTESTFLALMRLRGLECRAPSGYAEAFHAAKSVLVLR
ncbi:MAG TPA: PIG-L deacetylase family protein [Gemmatimonadales bacterium]|nr:PIG-L deacetylase family protein [Gemmatimonadales bacterium]